jgi:NAD(P)-dependent dehydrogenase (short-subunit alcohol dehydrogenase family)
LGAEAVINRMGAPSEVADAVAYLVGPHSSFLTGVALPVSGGLVAGI